MRWRRRRDREAELDRELRSDLELEALEQEEKGLSSEEARYAAKRALGNAGLIKEEIRAAWGWGWFDRLWQDVVYALRAFARAPGFTSVVVLTLALGIGSTTAVFSVVHAVLLNPLPFPNQNRLAIAFEQFISRPGDAPFADSYRDFENWKNGNRSFELLTVATWSVGPQILTGAGQARDVLAMPVGIDFFPALGIAPEVGRTFGQDDLNAGCSVVVKHSFWKETFAGEASAVGRSVKINNEACSVIGVMPPEFTFYPGAAEMWMLITPNSLRQLLTEGLLLSMTGAGLGVVLAIAAVHYFQVLNPIAMPPGNPARISLPVLGFTSLLVVVTTLLFGLIPALKASRVDLMEGLRVSAQAAALNRAARSLRKGLVVVEVALSLALSVAAGLLIQSVQRLASVPLGFRTDRVSTTQIILPGWIYSTSGQRAGFFRTALKQPVLASSGVSAAFASWLPPEGTGGDAVAIEGRSDESTGTGVPDVLQVSVSPAYFTAMGEPLRLGRVFEDTDDEKSPAVAIVNDAFGRKYFPKENPIGRRLKVLRGRGSDPPWLTIVGIVGDEKRQDFFRPMSWEEPPMVLPPGAPGTAGASFYSHSRG